MAEAVPGYQKSGQQRNDLELPWAPSLRQTVKQARALSRFW